MRCAIWRSHDQRLDRPFAKKPPRHAPSLDLTLKRPFGTYHGRAVVKENQKRLAHCGTKFVRTGGRVDGTKDNPVRFQSPDLQCGYEAPDSVNARPIRATMPCLATSNEHWE